jgi:hypothetical protein
VEDRGLGGDLRAARVPSVQESGQGHGRDSPSWLVAGKEARLAPRSVRFARDPLGAFFVGWAEPVDSSEGVGSGVRVSPVLASAVPGGGTLAGSAGRALLGVKLRLCN